MEDRNMKLRRLFALLVAALMLLGMIPAAQAQEIWCPDLGLAHEWGPAEYPYGTCEWGMHWCKRCGAGDEVEPQHKWVTRTIEEPTCTYPGWKSTECSYCGSEQSGPVEIPPLGHDWGPDKLDIAATCIMPGLKSRMCKRCNTREEWETDYGSHNWGEWKVTKTGDCLNPGEETRTCSLCGQKQTRTTAGGHAFGEWKETKAPTCTEPGRREHVCTRCGYTEWGTIRQLDHVFGVWYVVKPAQIGVAGLEQRDCTYGCGTYERREIPALNPDGSSTVGLQGLNVYKQLITPPTSESGMYAAGQEISYMITVENKTGVDLFDLEISDPLRSGNTVIASYKKMPAGQGVTVTFHYIITDADAANGSVVNTAYATGATAEGVTVRGTSNTVTVPLVKPEAKITKYVSVIPANGEYFVPGETIEYAVVFMNVTEHELHDVEVYDPLKGSNEDITITREPVVPPNGVLYLSFRYVVTEEDAARGTVVNTASAIWLNPETKEWSSCDSNTVTTLCGSTDNAAPCLTVDMTYTNTPANGEFFTPGEAIDYLITVTNTGDVPLTNLQVGNSSSEAVVPAPSEIAPGQTIQVPYYKLVYESDAKAGGIDSYGHANAFNGDPALPESLVSGRSADVFVPCGMGDGTPSVYYLKIVANAPANGLYFTEGETIKYRLSFGNNTKKDIYNITLNDPMANTRSVAFARRLKAGEFLMGEFEHVVTAADVEAGQIVNTATSTWATKAEGAQTTTPSNTVVTPCGSGVPSTGSIDAMLEKYVKNEPANGEYFVPGETIEYAVIFMNTCPHELHDVEVYDPLKGGNEDITIDREPIVAPNGTLYLSFNYTVTEEDAARGTVVNTASALWLNPETEEWSSCDSNTVTTLVGPAVTNDVAIIKTIENAPANGMYFVPGEVIQFAVAVQNNSAKTLDVVVLTDPLSADFFHELLDIPGGAMDSRTLSYTVTELDAEIGSVINYAYAVAYVDGNPTSLTSNSVTALCGFPEGEDPFGVLTGLDITKAVESLPLNGSYYTEGETVTYKITYANSGELPLTDVMIYDAMGGMSEIATAEMLTPGESRVCWFNHTVTADDVARGYISNTAIGQFELNGYVNSVSSNTVTVDTNGKQDLWTVHPFWPDDDSEYDPGTGWLPDEDPSTEGGMPPFGTIDTDTLRNGDAYCMRTITGRDNVSVGYETSFCAEHADTQASILAMMQIAATPEMQLQTAAYAVALWRSEAEKLYQDIFTAADPMAKATVMAEYIRFLTEVANYEALLKNLHPDQPALAAKKIAAMWEDKCVTLCYEMHATAAQRKDSLLSVTPATGAAASECACATTDEVNGKKTYTQSYCPVHGFPFGMIDMLLQGQDTAEAWTMVRQIWSVELSNAYNKAAAKLGVNSALAMAEYNALTQWMMAREASLIALYPENPEVVAQTMVKLIMDRVNDLCQVTK